MKRVIILGTGGNCIDILDAINDINESDGLPIYECRGFLDDNQGSWGMTIRGIKVLGPLGSASSYGDCQFVNGIGSESNFWKKKDIIARTGIPLEKFETIVHPSASVSKMATLGFGVVILQGVVVASNVSIGNHVIILPNAIVSHDDSIGDYTCIAGGACVSGGVAIGASCYLGANCSIISNITIGDRCLVGMGGVVIEPVGENCVVVGNPARVLRKTIETGA